MAITCGWNTNVQAVNATLVATTTPSERLRHRRLPDRGPNTIRPTPRVPKATPSR